MSARAFAVNRKVESPVLVMQFDPLSPLRDSKEIQMVYAH